MAVVIETTLGDITVDLYLEQRPATCLNFLKLCKMKYYNFNLFHTIRSGFIAQTGDPTGEGSGGESIWGLLEGTSKRFFSGEKMPKIRHTDAGLLSMVCTDNMMVGSQFFFTLAADLDSLDGVHCVIGEVTEGHEVLTKLNEVICDETHRPYQDVRITHTVILEDPFNDLPGLKVPSRSPSPNADRLRGGRIAPDEELDETQGKSHQEIQEMIEEKEAKARATILEIVGDLPDADIAPPENVLFVCKLNPVTTDDDLEIIFSRFGKIVSCEVIRDKKTGDSLQYAFIEFEDKKSCEDAYFKMDNVLIDDRRIHVDFSQSVSKMRWLGKGRGVQYFNEKESKQPEMMNNRSKRSHSREKNHSRRQHYKDRENKDRDKYTNDKKSDSLHRIRDRSRRDISKSVHNKSDGKNNDETDSRESNSNKHYKDSYPNKKRHDDIKDSNNSPERSKVKPKSPTKNDRMDQSRSPVRKEKEVMDQMKNYKTEKKSNDTHTSNSHKVSEKNVRDEPDQTEPTHHKSALKEHSNLKKDREYNSSNLDTFDGPRTPSPETGESSGNTKNDDKIKKVKKLKMRKNERRRKPSTSSSDSESSDSNSSSSESSSSSEGNKKKRGLKRKRRYRSSSSSSSTSSSTSSSDSTSSSSSSSSATSTSTSDSGVVKKRKKSFNKKSGKHTKNYSNHLTHKI